MPREGDVSDDAAAKDKSRVTRSLRKRLNSSDFEDSPVTSSQSSAKPSSASRILNSISEKDSDLDLDTSSSTLAPNEKPVPEGTIVRRTRARATSTLTEENVTALNNTPLRRTRRNSGAMEPSVISAAALPLSGTPSRRSTRRTSITSDDNASVTSSTLVTRPRRNVFVANANSEEEETPTLNTRKTPGRKSLVAPPATVPEESELDEITEISPTPRKTPNRSTRLLNLSSATASEQDEKDVKMSGNESLEDGPHPVAIHKSINVNTNQATPTKRVAVLLNRTDAIPAQARSIIEIMDDSESQSIIQVDDSPTNSPRKGQKSQTNTPLNINKSIKTEVKDEPIKESSNDQLNISPEETKLNASDSNQVNKDTIADNNTSNTSSVFLETSEDLSTQQNLSQKKNNDSTANDNNAAPCLDTSNTISKCVETNDISVEHKLSPKSPKTPNNQSHNTSSENHNDSLKIVETPSNDASIAETKGSSIDASRNSVAGSKSVTFAEVAPNGIADNSGKSDDVFHDTCTDFADNDESDDVTPDAVHKIHAGATPSRTRFNLSLRCSTPLVAATTAASKEAASQLATAPAKVSEISTPISEPRKRGRPPKNRASISTVVPTPVELEKPIEPLSRSWSQAVHGTSSSQIDKSTQDVSTEEVIKRPVPKPQLDDFIDDEAEEEEDDEEKNDSSKDEAHNSFVNDEAEEANEDYEDGDSMDSVMKEYLATNEIPADGVSIGSKDSEHGNDDEECEEEEADEEMDSFIVSDGDEEADLLDGSGDDLSDGCNEKEVAKPRRSVLRLADSSEDEEDVEAKQDIVSSEGDKEFNDDTTLVSTEVVDELVEIEEEKEVESPQLSTSIDVSERQTNKLLSKTINDITDEKQETKLNKSLGSRSKSTAIDFSVYVQKNKPKDDSVDSETANSSIDIPERQISNLLSKSVHEAGKQNKKKSKLNKSLGTPMETDDTNVSFSSYVADKKLKSQTSVEINDEKQQDVEMASPPKIKTHKVKTPKVKEPIAEPSSLEAILNRCQTLLNQAKEARQTDKLQNKKEIPEEVVERIKSKREQKQLEKAKRAANLLKLQQDEAERIKRKAEKKLLKKSKITETTEEISKAIAHGIDLLTKSTNISEKTAVPQPITVQSAVTDFISNSEKSKKKKHIPEAIKEIQPEEVVPPKSKKSKKNKALMVNNSATEEKTPQVETMLKKHKKTASVIHSFDEPQPIVKKQKKISSSLESVDENQPFEKKQKIIKSKTELLNSDQPEKIAKKLKKSAPTLEALENVHQSENTAKKHKKSKKIEIPVEHKGKRLLESDDSVVQSVPKKLKVSKVEKKRLNILAHSSSSEHDPEPIKKLAQKPTEYNVLQVRSVATQEKAVSRKRKPTAPPSPVKPQWTSAGEFLVSKMPFKQSENVLHVHHKSYGTDFIVTSLSKKRKIKASESETTAAPLPVHAQVAEYRAKVTNDGDRVKRETTAQMLQHKKKMQAYTRF